jgi:hypothetical protein
MGNLVRTFCVIWCPCKSYSIGPGVPHSFDMTVRLNLILLLTRIIILTYGTPLESWLSSFPTL